eukprot:5043579-Pleurochrysis_carterae.AAC.3
MPSPRRSACEAIYNVCGQKGTGHGFERSPSQATTLGLGLEGCSTMSGFRALQSSIRLEIPGQRLFLARVQYKLCASTQVNNMRLQA